MVRMININFKEFWEILKMIDLTKKNNTIFQGNAKLKSFE